jgi:hypothetical protein
MLFQVRYQLYRKVRHRSLFGNVPADIVSRFVLSYALHIRVVLPLCFQRSHATTDGVIIAHSVTLTRYLRAGRLGSTKIQPRLSHVSLACSVSQGASRDTNVQAVVECSTRFATLDL